MIEDLFVISYIHYVNPRYIALVARLELTSNIHDCDVASRIIPFTSSSLTYSDDSGFWMIDDIVDGHTVGFRSKRFDVTKS